MECLNEFTALFTEGQKEVILWFGVCLFFTITWAVISD